MISSAAAPEAKNAPKSPCQGPPLIPETSSLGRPVWQRFLQVGTGHSLYAAFCWLFDHVLYVYVVYQLGPLVGGAIMTLASFGICMLTLLAYERIGVDWVGGSLVKELMTKENPGLMGRILVWVGAQHPTAVFLVLCAFFDPFITTAYFRAGAFDGLRKRDWQIFIVSVLVSNLYWIFVADLIGHAVAAAWDWLTN